MYPNHFASIFIFLLIAFSLKVGRYILNIIKNFANNYKERAYFNNY
jgi:hypothetical protein